MKTMLAAGMLLALSGPVLAQSTGAATCAGAAGRCQVEGCVTVGGECEYDATSGGSIFGQGKWLVEVWWNTTCETRSGSPNWIVASDGGSPSSPGDGNNVGGVAGTWEGSVSGAVERSCVRASALTPSSSVAVGNVSAPPLAE